MNHRHRVVSEAEVRSRLQEPPLRPLRAYLAEAPFSTSTLPLPDHIKKCGISLYFDRTEDRYKARVAGRPPLRFDLGSTPVFLAVVDQLWRETSREAKPSATVSFFGPDPYTSSIPAREKPDEREDLISPSAGMAGEDKSLTPGDSLMPTDVEVVTNEGPESGEQIDVPAPGTQDNGSPDVFPAPAVAMDVGFPNEGTSMNEESRASEVPQAARSGGTIPAYDGSHRLGEDSSPGGAVADADSAAHSHQPHNEPTSSSAKLPQSCEYRPMSVLDDAGGPAEPQHELRQSVDNEGAGLWAFLEKTPMWLFRCLVAAVYLVLPEYIGIGFSMGERLGTVALWFWTRA